MNQPKTIVTTFCPPPAPYRLPKGFQKEENEYGTCFYNLRRLIRDFRYNGSHHDYCWPVEYVLPTSNEAALADAAADYDTVRPTDERELERPKMEIILQIA